MGFSRGRRLEVYGTNGEDTGAGGCVLNSARLLSAVYDAPTGGTYFMQFKMAPDDVVRVQVL